MINNEIYKFKSILNNINSQDLPSSFKQEINTNLDNIHSIYDYGKSNVIKTNVVASNQCPVCQRPFNEFSGIKSEIINASQCTPMEYGAQFQLMFQLVNSLEEKVMFREPFEAATVEPSPNRCGGCGRKY